MNILFSAPEPFATPFSMLKNFPILKILSVSQLRSQKTKFIKGVSDFEISSDGASLAVVNGIETECYDIESGAINWRGAVLKRPFALTSGGCVLSIDDGRRNLKVTDFTAAANSFTIPLKGDEHDRESRHQIELSQNGKFAVVGSYDLLDGFVYAIDL